MVILFSNYKGCYLALHYISCLYLHTFRRIGDEMQRRLQELQRVLRTFTQQLPQSRRCRGSPRGRTAVLVGAGRVRERTAAGSRRSEDGGAAGADDQSSSRRGGRPEQQSPGRMAGAAVAGAAGADGRSRTGTGTAGRPAGAG